MPKNRVIMKRVAAQPSVPGFRPGRAPKHMSDDVSGLDAGAAMSKTISRYVGSDWLSKLETVIGNLSSIDDSKYKEVIAKIGICENNIRVCFKIIAKNANITDAFTDIFNRFVKVITETDITHKAFVQKKNKKGVMRDVLVASYVPSQLLKSEWFEVIKEIEREIYKYIEKLFISPDGDIKIAKSSKERKDLKVKYDYESFKALMSKYPNLNGLVSIFGVKPATEQVYNAFMDMQKFANGIINMIMTPMYDVQAKVTRSYDHDLAHAFKSTVDRGFATRELIIELLTNFACAQYKASITGNSKYFLQMLSDELSEGALSQMDGARFISVMDSINTDAISKGSKAVEFTVKAKDIMKKMIEQDGKLGPAVLSDIKELIVGDDVNDETDDGTKAVASLPEELEKALTQFDDLLEPDAEEEKRE